MIQELLGGGAGLIGGERKISIAGVLEGSSPSPSPSSSSPSPSSSAAANPATSSAPENQNLRCPRCDSSNTKFCYYNNYNLTQPRHFCKTCRRYWTKGGALRNVPIGGGCRKNKTVSVTTSAGKSSAAGRLKTVVSSEIGKSTLGLVGGFDHELTSNPILWASPQNSHLLALLRANHNPNPNPNSVTVKEESVMIGSAHMNSELSARALGFNNQVPSIGLCSPFWRSNHQQNQAQHHQQQNHHHHHHHQQQHNGFVLGEVQNTGIQDLYQRLRPSSVSNYYPHHPPVLLSNVGSSSSSSSTILDSAPVAAAGELDYWNPTLSWSDLPTTNGAYP